MAKKSTAKPARKSKPAAKPRTKKAATGNGVIDRADADPLNPVVKRGDNVDLVNTFKTSTKDQLERLAKRYKSMKEDAQGKAGEISAMLQKAEETQHLDSWCFKEAMKWKKMSDDKKVRRLPIFMKYLDDLGVVLDATAQADLLAAVEKDRVEEEAQGDLEDQPTDEEKAAAATGLAPSRRPSSGLQIVPKDDEASAAAG